VTLSSKVYFHTVLVIHYASANGYIGDKESSVRLAGSEVKYISDCFRRDGFSINTTLLDLNLNKGMTLPHNQLVLINFHRFHIKFSTHFWPCPFLDAIDPTRPWPFLNAIDPTCPWPFLDAINPTRPWPFLDAELGTLHHIEDAP
jgi:hypothetical protein